MESLTWFFLSNTYRILILFIPTKELEKKKKKEKKDIKPVTKVFKGFS